MENTIVAIVMLVAVVYAAWAIITNHDTWEDYWRNQTPDDDW